MSLQVKENPFDQPDVSRVTPVYVPKNGLRSYDLNVTIINQQGRYQVVRGYWHDVEKRWEYASSGLPIEFKVVRSEPIAETEKHYSEEV